MINNKTKDIIDVAIIGGGISGLVSALLLNHLKISVRIYEQCEHISSSGFGLSLQPYCVKVLYELGFENELNEIGVKTNKVLFYSRHGKFIYEDSRGLDQGNHWPMYAVRRKDFIQLLYRHVQLKLGQSSIEFSHKLIKFTKKSDYLYMDFINTKTGQIKIDQAKFLIGADGINSTIRKILYPNEGAPICRGLHIWRGITSMDKVYLNGRTMICMGNPNSLYLIIYPLKNNFINWACVIKHRHDNTSSSSSSSDTLDWSRRDNSDDILPFIQEMKLDFLDVNQMIKSSVIANQFQMTDRDIIPQWTFDRVTLIGDAAHPMYPYGGNGASQAILDAQQLYLSFLRYGLTTEALQDYENHRRPITNQFVLSAREYGPDKFLRLVDERLSDGFENLSDIISSEEIQSIIFNSKQISERNQQLLNSEKSLL